MQYLICAVYDHIITSVGTTGDTHFRRYHQRPCGTVDADDIIAPITIHIVAKNDVIWAPTVPKLEKIRRHYLLLMLFCELKLGFMPQNIVF